MLTNSRLTIATAFAVAVIAAPAATAMPAEPQNLPAHTTPADPRQADMHASTVIGPDARGEHAASLADDLAAPDDRTGDQRTPDAVEQFVRPVVVEVGDPVSPGFDWTAAIIGIAGGLAFAVLAGAAVTGGRRRRTGASTV
jgi:hypothetical protein